MEFDNTLLIDAANEFCWETGRYIGDYCVCELCDHKYECSGYEDKG